MNVKMLNHGFVELCKGGFGTIYVSKKDDNIIVKTQNKKDFHLKNEQEFYSIVKDEKRSYIPTFFTAGISKDKRYLIMERFPCDLHQFFKKSEHVSKKIRYDMTIQLIKAISFIHSFGYSHGDVKLQNILLREDETKIKICDFGLAKRFLHNDNSHVKYEKGKLGSHRGSVHFVSEDSHEGVIPSRRSDLENVGWLLSILILDKQLPWIRWCNKNNILDSKRKAKKDLATFFKTMQTCYKRCTEYMSYVCALRYEDKPDYDRVISIFE